jgi:hypothetical protein
MEHVNIFKVFHYPIKSNHLLEVDSIFYKINFPVQVNVVCQIRLQNATPTIMNLTFQPGAMGYDQANPDEAAVAGYGASILYWFNPATMTFLRNSTIDISYSLAVYNNQTFTAFSNIPSIYIRDSQTNNRLANITYSSLGQVRKIIFINNGQTAVVPTQNNFTLTFFNVNSPTNYTIQVKKSIVVSSEINQR